MNPFFLGLFRNAAWVAGFLLLTFQSMAQQKAPLILISKEYDNLSYSLWIGKIDHKVRWASAYGKPLAEIEKLMKEAAGFLLTGGKDVHPSLYGKADDVERCGAIDEYRDSLEIKLIRYALDNKIPLLCVCRGEQILNVSAGGSLIIDIPEDVGETTAHTDTTVGYDAIHPVTVQEGTFLYRLVGEKSGTINSKHHQAVDKPAPGWLVSAIAPDGVAEALEMSAETRKKTGHPFALGVQWHPERMDVKSPFSGKILAAYLKEVNRIRR